MVIILEFIMLLVLFAYGAYLRWISRFKIGFNVTDFIGLALICIVGSLLGIWICCSCMERQIIEPFFFLR